MTTDMVVAKVLGAVGGGAVWLVSVHMAAVQRVGFSGLSPQEVVASNAPLLFVLVGGVIAIFFGIKQIINLYEAFLGVIRKVVKQVIEAHMEAENAERERLRTELRNALSRLDSFEKKLKRYLKLRLSDGTMTIQEIAQAMEEQANEEEEGEVEGG